MALGFFDAVDPVEQAKNPNYVAAKRRILEALQKEASSTAPVQHWSQGAARLANALANRYEENILAKGEKAANEEFNKVLMAALGGQNAAGVPGAPPGPAAAPGAVSPSVPGAPSPDPASVFQRMLKQESGNRQFDGSGNTITSPAGALGIAQIMPGTAPEAAKLAGLPLDMNRLRTDPAYNKTLGQAYFNAQQQKYGDPYAAAAAYNAGPGAVDKAISRQDATGRPFTDFLPAETGNYMAQVGAGEGQQPGPVSGLAMAPTNVPPRPGMQALAQAVGVPGGPSPAGMPQAAPAAPQGGINPALVAMMTNPNMAARMQKNPLLSALLVKQFGKNPVEQQLQLLQLQKMQQDLQGGNPLQRERAALEIQSFRKKIGEEPAPNVQKLKMPDGSEQAVQWDKTAKKFVPLDAPAGGKGFAPKLTEGQSKDQAFYTRGTDANNRLEKVEKSLTSVGNAAKAALPGGNMLVDKDFQTAQRHSRDFLAVVLRKDTGAAVTPQEFEMYGQIYLPKVGDSAQVIADKRRARGLALEAIKRGLGNVQDIVNYSTTPKAAASPQNEKKPVVINGVTITPMD